MLLDSVVCGVPVEKHTTVNIILQVASQADNPPPPQHWGSILQAGFIEEDLGDNTSFILRLGYNAVKKDWVWLGEGENKEV